jgi:hypothetical protein
MFVHGCGGPPRAEAGMRYSALGFVLLLASSGVAEGRPGAVPIYRPTTISAPGTYVVTRDITATGGNAVVIASDNVTLDLNGHTLRSAGQIYPVVYADNGYENIVIENGRIAGGDSGVRFENAGRWARVALRRLTVFESGSVGISIGAAAHVEIVECQIHDTGTHGITVSGGSKTFGGRIAQNVIERVGSYGMNVYGMRGGEIAGNVISMYGNTMTGAVGIYLSGMTGPAPGGIVVRGNAVAGDGLDDRGLVIESTAHDNLVTGNTFTRNGGTAIELKSISNRVTSNTIAHNGAGLVVTGARNLVEDNLFDSNTGADLSLDAGGSTLYRNNVIHGSIVGTGIDLGGNW